MPDGSTQDGIDFAVMTAIAQRNVAFLKKHYETSPPALHEFLLASASRFPENAPIARLIWEAFPQNDQFLDFGLAALKNNAALFREAAQSPTIRRQVGPYKNELISAISEQIQELEGVMRSNPATRSRFMNRAADWEEVVGELEGWGNQPQKTSSAAALCASSDRLCAAAQDENTLRRMDLHLAITIYLHAIQSGRPLLGISELFDQAKGIRNQLASAPATEKSIHPLVKTLHDDIVHALISRPDSTADCHTLWADAPGYGPTAAWERTTAFAKLPEKLQALFPGDKKVRCCIYVVLENGQLLLADGEVPITPGQRAVHHTDIANGRPVLAAGGIYFSDSPRAILAITNQSGHYRPPLESCNEVIGPLRAAGLDCSRTVITDFSCQTIIPIPQEPSLAGKVHAYRDSKKPPPILSEAAPVRASLGTTP